MNDAKIIDQDAVMAAEIRRALEKLAELLVRAKDRGITVAFNLAEDAAGRMSVQRCDIAKKL